MALGDRVHYKVQALSSTRTKGYHEDPTIRFGDWVTANSAVAW